MGSRVGTSIAIALVVGGCQPALPFLATPEPTPPGAHEDMPSFADVRIDGVPLVAIRPVTIGIAQPEFADTATIRAGEAIHAAFEVSSGDYRLSVDPDACILPVTLAPETETDVELRLRQDGTCQLVVLRQHAPEAFDHADGSMGALSAQVPAGIGAGVVTMDLRSLDDPPNPVPAPDTVDESGLLQLFDVPTGRYEARLLLDGEPVATATIEVDPFGRSDPIVFVLPSG